MLCPETILEPFGHVFGLSSDDPAPEATPRRVRPGPRSIAPRDIAAGLFGVRAEETEMPTT